MTRKTFPVPEDRSQYSPVVLLEGVDIDYLFEKANGKPTDPDNLRETVNWVTDKAFQLGWGEVIIFGGRQMLLKANIKVTWNDGRELKQSDDTTSTMTKGEFESYQER